MPHDLISIITTSDPAVRNRSLNGFCRTAEAAAIIDERSHPRGNPASFPADFPAFLPRFCRFAKKGNSPPAKTRQCPPKKHEKPLPCRPRDSRL
jgi:hypothetical protein